MKLGCVIGLLLYAAFVYGYYVWLGQTFEGKELWIASFIVGLIATLGVGALGNSYYAWRDGAVLSDALIDMPRRDGKRTAVAGTLEPLGQPLAAPLSGKPCVMYEYDIFRQVTRTKKDGGTETSKDVDFAGVGKTECIIRSTSSQLRLIGFPDLEPLTEEHLGEEADVLRARQYVQFTPWEDTSGLGVLRGVREMFNTLTGNEESFRKDWRMISAGDCAWLRAEPAANPAAEPAATGETHPNVSGKSAANRRRGGGVGRRRREIRGGQRLDQAGVMMTTMTTTMTCHRCGTTAAATIRSSRRNGSSQGSRWSPSAATTKCGKGSSAAALSSSKSISTTCRRSPASWPPRSGATSSAAFSRW
jgi:hypothetical protein